MLRLNVAVPPSKSPNPHGLVAGDAAGFPNGPTVFDDVVTVELRAGRRDRHHHAGVFWKTPRSSSAVPNLNPHTSASLWFHGSPEGHTIQSAVFFDVPEGRYYLAVLPDGPIQLTVEVRSGQVTEATWPGYLSGPPRPPKT